MDAIYIALLEILIARFELVVERPEARSQHTQWILCGAVCGVARRSWPRR